MLIDLRPYSDEVDYLMSISDDELEMMWIELVFTRYHKDVALEIRT